MKILHICETAIGGVASYLNLINDIGGDTTNVFVVPQDHAKALDAELDVRPYLSPGRGLKGIWANIKATKQAIRAESPDIIFFHSSFSLLALAAVRLGGDRRAAIYCAHGWAASMFEGGGLKRWLVQRLEGGLAGLATRVINISESDLRLAKDSRYRGPHILVENGVDDTIGETTGALFASEPDAIHLLFVGRHDRQKGLDLLIEAFAKVGRERQDLRLHIVGSGVRSDGEAVDLPEGASLSGWISQAEIDDWYASSDALVVPSRWEGFGLVVPEAFRNGTPVICSDRGALPSLVEPDRTGKVFSLEGDDLEQCLRGLNKVELQGYRASCRAAYEERFTAARVRQQIGDLYSSLMDAPA